MSVHTVSFAGNSVAIQYDLPEAKEVLDFLYRDLGSDTSIKPHVTLRIDREEHAGEDNWALYKADKRIYRGASKASLANILVGETIHQLTDKSKDGMALHAGALSRDGRAIMLPGRSGAGKSTLTTWLTRRGFNYLTDELVFVPEYTRSLECFTRPINIKRRGLPALKTQFDLDAHASETLATRQVTMIPHRLLNPDNRTEETELALILFPNHQDKSELELKRLSKAQVGLALMECLVNARNLNGHGFNEATRLAREVPAYRLTYSRFGQLNDVLTEILP